MRRAPRAVVGVKALWLRGEGTAKTTAPSPRGSGCALNVGQYSYAGHVTTLRDPLAQVMGKKASDTFEKVFGLRTVGDLLRHYPRRYYTRGELTPLDSLSEGDHVTVLARVAMASVIGGTAPGQRPNAPPGRGHYKQRLEVIVTDGTGKLQLTFFAGVGFHAKQLKQGTLALFAGTVSSFRGRRQLVHPEYELLPVSAADERLTAELAEEFATELIPVYPASAKLTSWAISRHIDAVLETLDAGEDPLPEPVRAKHDLWPRELAIRAIHRPTDREDLRHARKRLKWDEAFTMQAALAQRRHAAAAMPAVPRPPIEDGIAAAFDRRLPFTLTAGQRSVGEVIAHDLACAYPMNRLLQGEVGSGKTVVAVRAMLQVVDAGGQAALLAPTEVLAQQHYRSISALLGPLGAAGQLGAGQLGTGELGTGEPGTAEPGSGAPGVAEQATRVALLTGSTGVRARRSALSDVFTGDAGILIGTHALLEDQVQFADLGLVVIDEQHRFGVEQRDALREKAAGSRPHVLVMTATPIPRTVAMTVFGDLEVSTLSELPAGRSPIATHVVPAVERPHYLDRAWQRVREEVAAGRQAYVVCPRIGDADDDGDGADLLAPGPGPDAPEDPVLENPGPGEPVLGDPAQGDGQEARRPPLAVLEVAPELAEGPLAGLRVGIMHGRLVPDEKDRVMTAFAAGELDVLVSTTVIEVGVDVANATVMVIMDAERFGVSQLHQLRGRVGRGRNAGLCLLVTEAPPASPARERLDAVAATGDGFQLSRLDLQQRREGDVLGSAQAGRRSSLKLLRLLADEDLIATAREEAATLVAADPKLAGHPALKEAIDDFLGDRRAEFLDKA
jgi:ATP-dependent DNA helicase RecG